jgi:hypothetical protein
LRQLRSIRRFLSKEAVLTVIHAFVTSRVDYCNSVLFGCPGYVLDSLQSILNAAARMIHGSSRYDHVSPLLQQLHWLSAPCRIEYKVAITVFNCLKGSGPQYLTDMLLPQSTYSRRPGLRSSDTGLLQTVRRSTRSLGKHSFRESGPTVWNSLPANLRIANWPCHQFCKSVKTALFNSKLA